MVYSGNGSYRIGHEVLRMFQTLRCRPLVVVAGPALLLALVVTMSHSLGSAAPAYPVEDFLADTAYAVTRILAGDAIEIDVAGRYESIQLVGVDDQGARSREASEGAAQGDAARLTRGLLLGEAVYLRRMPAARRVSGRTPAYVYRAPDGLFVNLELVRQGCASSASVPHPHSALFAAYDRRARDAARGMWAPRATDARAVSRSEKVSQPPARPIRSHAADVTVYVTRTGKKYHADGCRSLARSKIASPLAEAKRTLTPCSVCKPPL